VFIEGIEGRPPPNPLPTPYQPPINPLSTPYELWTIGGGKAEENRG